jgi:hypothetical protein
MQQHISTTHQTCLEPKHPTPQQKWDLQLDMQNSNLSYVGQTSHNLKTCFQEHNRYIKTNNPQSAYAQHILHNRHEYGTIAETMTLIKAI